MAAAPPIPATKDLRATWWKVNDQGSTGSCVGWATADSVVRWHLAKAGRIANADLLSPRFVWMAAKETDSSTARPTTFVETEGTSLKAALDIVRKYGAIRDKLMPFAAGTLFPGDAKTFYALAAQLKILAYFNLGSNLSNWRTWLATKGPILTRLDVDRTWDQAPATKGVLEEYKPATARGGHAVALVGYRPGSFIVRNSWGTDLGRQGLRLRLAGLRAGRVHRGLRDRGLSSPADMSRVRPWTCPFRPSGAWRGAPGRACGAARSAASLTISST